MRPAAWLLVPMLVACENSATLSLAASGSLNVQQVRLAITQVQLKDDGGNLVEIDSADAGVHDLKDLGEGGLVTLLSAAAIPSGRYTGLALVYAAESAEVVAADGTRWPLALPAQPVFAATNFSVLRKDDVALWSSLDLRLSLSDQTATSARWQLVPHLNIANLETDATLRGFIDASVGLDDSCLQGRSNHDGAAVYAWPGAGVTPHDESPGGAPALATAAVTWNSDGSGSYRFAHLAPGAYTVALDCVSLQDDPLSAQGQAFAARGEVTLGEGETATLDFDAPGP